MKNIVLKQRAERDDLASRPYYTRKHIQDVAPYLEAIVIKLITGPRRAGKSVYALQILSGKNYAYLNFDDTQLLGTFNEDSVMQALAEVYPGYEYLLLDEVQNLESWDAWVSKLYRRGVNLVITGSNANLLSSGAPINAELPEEKAKLFIEMADYLKKGGYPEIVKNREIEQAYLTALFDSIILKDVAQRHKIRKITELYDLADYLISNYSSPLSYNEIADELSLGSVTTVKKFCGYLAEPYLFFYLPRYNNKLKEMKKAPRKVYVIDNGFIYTRSFELSSNNGRQLENMVFIELLRRGFDLKKSLFYYRTSNDKEVDFVTRDGRKVTSLIQVSYDISKTKTRERELDALVKASEELKCDNLLLITWDKEDSVDYKGKVIRIEPVYKWLSE